MMKRQRCTNTTRLYALAAVSVVLILLASPTQAKDSKDVEKRTENAKLIFNGFEANFTTLANSRKLYDYKIGVSSSNTQVLCTFQPAKVNESASENATSSTYLSDGYENFNIWPTTKLYVFARRGAAPIVEFRDSGKPVSHKDNLKYTVGKADKFKAELVIHDPTEKASEFIYFTVVSTADTNQFRNELNIQFDIQDPTGTLVGLVAFVVFVIVMCTVCACNRRHGWMLRSCEFLDDDLKEDGTPQPMVRVYNVDKNIFEYHQLRDYNKANREFQNDPANYPPNVFLIERVDFGDYYLPKTPDQLQALMDKEERIDWWVVDPRAPPPKESTRKSKNDDDVQVYGASAVPVGSDEYSEKEGEEGDGESMSGSGGGGGGAIDSEKAHRVANRAKSSGARRKVEEGAVEGEKYAAVGAREGEKRGRYAAAEGGEKGGQLADEGQKHGSYAAGKAKKRGGELADEGQKQGTYAAGKAKKGGKKVKEVAEKEGGAAASAAKSEGSKRGGRVADDAKNQKRLAERGADDVAENEGKEAASAASAGLSKSRKATGINNSGGGKNGDFGDKVSRGGETAAAAGAHAHTAAETAADSLDVFVIILLVIIGYFVNGVKVMLNLALLHSSFDRMLPKGQLPSVAQLRDITPSIDFVWSFAGIFESFTDLDETLKLWNCHGALLTFFPALVFVVLGIMYVVIHEDLLLFAAIRMRSWKGKYIFKGKSGDAFLTAFSSLCQSVMLYVVQVTLVIVASLFVGFLRSEASCSGLDLFLSVIGRYFTFILACFAIAVTLIVFSGRPTRNFYGRSNFVQILGIMFDSIVRLFLLTFGFWTKRMVRSHQIARRADTFDDDEEDEDNQHERVMSVTGRSRSIIFFVPPGTVILAKIAEVMNNPPVFVFSDEVELITTKWHRRIAVTFQLITLLCIIITLFGGSPVVLALCFISLIPTALHELYQQLLPFCIAAQAAAAPIASDAQDIASDVGSYVGSYAGSIASEVSDVASDVGSDAESLASDAASYVSSEGEEVMRAGRGAAVELDKYGRPIARDVGSAASSLASDAESAASSVASDAESVASSVASDAESAASSVASDAESVASDVYSYASDVASEARLAASEVGSYASSLASDAESVASSVGSDVSSAASSVGSAVESEASSLASDAQSEVESEIESVAGGEYSYYS